MKRFFVHGDVRDDGSVYCLFCDSFQPAMHVVTDHAGDLRAVLRSVADHYKHREGRGAWYRPRDARNVLIK